MSSISKIFSPIRRAAAAFFKHDLALKRERDGLHIVLEAKAPVEASSGKDVTKKSKPTKGEREKLAERKVAEELALMRQHSISQLVVEEAGKYLGMVHLHDLVREGLV